MEMLHEYQVSQQVLDRNFPKCEKVRQSLFTF